MKNLILCLVLVMSARLLKSQTNFGKTMVVGTWGYKIKYVAPNLYLHDTVIPYPVKGFFRGSSNISDSNGNLILMSDGYNIYDDTGNYIEEGDTLSPHNWYNMNQGEGRYTQTALFLPMANKKYYFVNVSMTDTQYTKAMNAIPWEYPTNILLYHVVDMNANGGAGKVTERMKPMLENVDLFPAGMMACRHANGKDWWLLKQGGDSTLGNVVYKFLFKQDTVLNMGMQVLPYPFKGYLWNFTQYAISQDGSKWAASITSASTEGEVFLADFDRCTGILSNYSKINIMPFMNLPNGPTISDSVNLGVCFSPNGQFLYVSRYHHVVQYNLQTGSQYKVCGMDTTEQTFQGYSKINLGPDGRVYINNYQGNTEQMSYIESPNVDSAGCNFCRKCMRSVKIINGYFLNVGEMPNYELGADLPCWPLGNGAVALSEKKIQLYPNPFNDMLTIANIQLPKEKGMLLLCDMTGKILFHTELSGVSNSITVSLPPLSKGVYFYKYIKDGVSIETGKLTKE